MKDPNFLAKIRKLSCVATGSAPPSDPHHVRSRGSGGDDSPWNVIPLSRKAHAEWHQLGWKRFLKKFPHVREYLEALGWEVFNGKLIHGAKEENES